MKTRIVYELELVNLCPYIKHKLRYRLQFCIFAPLCTNEYAKKEEEKNTTIPVGLTWDISKDCERNHLLKNVLVNKIVKGRL